MLRLRLEIVYIYETNPIMEQQEYMDMIGPLLPKMRRTAFRYVGCEADAEDVVQEASLRLWQLGDRLRGVRCLEALAVTIVKRLSFNILKHRAVRGGVVALWRIVSVAAEPCALDAQAELDEVRLLMERLPGQQREVLRMRHLEGLETEEIARLLGMTPEAVRMNLSRARKRIRKLYDQG